LLCIVESYTKVTLLFTTIFEKTQNAFLVYAKLKERKSLLNVIINLAASFLFWYYTTSWYPMDFLSLAAIYFGKKTDASRY